MINEEIIKNWGVPESIKDKNIEFIFSIKDLNFEITKDNVIGELYCYDKVPEIFSCILDGGSKFCLYNKENNKIIFTMEFKIFKNKLFDEKQGKSIQLKCICTNDSEMRYKGIAPYYLKKLIEFGIDNNINIFYLYPNPYDEAFEGIGTEKTLTKERLEDFYIKHFKELGFNHKYYYEHEECEGPSLLFIKC